MLAAVLLLVGCGHRPRPALTGQEPTGFDARINAVPVPPTGWKMKEAIVAEEHAHLVWVSPSGSVAYGVVYFDLPLPVSAKAVVPFYVERIRRETGSAELIEQQSDTDRGAERFVVDSAEHRMRVLLYTRGFAGWAVYAGTLRARAPVEAELNSAEQARDATRLDW